MSPSYSCHFPTYIETSINDKGNKNTQKKKKKKGEVGIADCSQKYSKKTEVRNEQVMEFLNPNRKTP